MAYTGRDWDSTGTKVTKEDFKRIEKGIKNNDTAIAEQANKIEDNTNQINVLSNNGLNGSLVDGITLPTNMNNVNSPGQYEVVWDTTNISNFPPVTKGVTRLRIKVEKLIENMYRQEIELQEGVVASGVWYRSFVDGVWQPWQQIATTTNIPLIHSLVWKENQSLNQSLQSNYYNFFNASAGFPAGYTTDNDFIVVVIGSSLPWQRHFLLDVRSNRQFSRAITGGVIGDWREF